MTFIIVEILFFALLLVGDLLSKHYIMPFLLENGRHYVLIDKVLALNYQLNEGAGFSMLSGKKDALIAITSVAMVIILLLIVVLHLRNTNRTHRGRFLNMVLVMMLAGGIGNLVDRIMFGYVRDFIEYTIIETLFGKPFAICNIADIYLTVGMVLVIVYVLFLWRDPKAVKPREPEDDPADTEVDVSRALNEYFASRPEAPKAPKERDKAPEDKPWPKE